MTEPQDSINFYMCIYTPKTAQIRQLCNLSICHSWKIPSLRKWQKQEQMTPDFCPTTQESGDSDGLLAWQFQRHRRQGQILPGVEQGMQKEPRCGTESQGSRAVAPLTSPPGLAGAPSPSILGCSGGCGAARSSCQVTSKMFVLAATCRVIP